MDQHYSVAPGFVYVAAVFREISMPVFHHLVFTGQMPFWPCNQWCQSTEGTKWKRIKDFV